MIDSSRFIEDIGAELRARIDPGYRESMRRSNVLAVDNLLGVRLPGVRQVAAAGWPRAKALPIDDRLELCTRVIEAGAYEHKVIAFDWAHRSRKELAARHWPVLAGWLARYVEDWNDCDDLATHALGDFVARFPDAAAEVVQWTASRNRWMRRGAAVALIPALRRGRLLDQALAVADRLLPDRDDLVQKGLGWMLKEASKRHPREVFDYVLAHRADLSRTALRYAVEKLDPDLKRLAMEREPASRRAEPRGPSVETPGNGPAGA